MKPHDDEEALLRSVAVKNAKSILLARRRAEQELMHAKEALERKTQELEEETRILELLNETGTLLASNLDLHALLQVVTDAGTQVSGARFGAFFYNTTDENGEVFQLYTLSGAPREAFEKFGHPRPTPLFAPTFTGAGTIRIDDVLADPRYGQWGPHHDMPADDLPVRSYLAASVTARSGEVLGALLFGHPDVGVFDDRAERIVTGIAAQAAVAIDNARLYEAAQKAAEERSHLLENEQVARAEAERMSAMKDEFLATLSHELRTPLSAILGWAQVLRRGTRDDAELHKGLETIERNARVQTQLIEDLLDMSRITSGKLRLDIQSVETIPVIEAAIETVRPAADARGIILEKSLDAAAGPVSGDPSRLQQVIWNLLSNAIKFTAAGGKVKIALHRRDAQIEIVVADTGVGISPEFLPHVFDRFRQADASSTRTHGGLGLGLAIVKQLVELHGGTVAVTSAGLGRGATFAVRLPPAMPHRAGYYGSRLDAQTEGASLPLDFKQADLSGVKVLVVDDEADARELIARVLLDCDAEVFTAGTAEEALRLLQKENPDVLLTDIGMPGADGFELLRGVRALGGAFSKIPAIAVTAFARSEDRTRALRAGFLVHVPKPVEPSELAATVATVAGRTSDELKA